MVSGSDPVQLVLKPLSESLGRLVLLVWIGVHGDAWDYNPGKDGGNKTGKTTSLMQLVRGMD